MGQIFQCAKINLASLPCSSMLSLLRHASSTRLQFCKNVKMSASDISEVIYVLNCFKVWEPESSQTILHFKMFNWALTILMRVCLVVKKVYGGTSIKSF